MHKKCIAITIIAIIVVGAGAFYGGMQYNKSKLASQGLLRGGNNATGFQDGNRQSGGQGQNRQGIGGAGRNGENFATGEIISKDDKSITVKNQDGSSKIIFFSDSTTVGKTVQGVASDLNTGEQVMANGKSNPDGSLAAQNIQIRLAQNQ